MPLRDRLIIDPRTLLSCIPLFAGLPTQPMARLAAGCRVLNLAVTNTLFKPGEVIQNAHFLVTGSIKRCAIVSDSVQRVIELVRPGQLFGLSEVFTSNTYSSLSEAIEPSVVIAITLDTLIDVATNEPALSLRLLKSMAQRSYASEFEATSHHSMSVTQRVLDYLLHLAGDNRNLAGETTVLLDASKKLIAARLDMAAETFSRTLRQLSDDGLIVVRGRFVHLQNATLISNHSHPDKTLSPPARYPKLDRGAKEPLISPASLINLCGCFRLHSQLMASMWCMSARKISSDSANVTLRKYRQQFENNLTRLSGEVASLGIAESYARLTLLWPRYCDALCREPLVIANAQTIFNLSEIILEVADQLTIAAAISAGTREANLVNIAGRNRMLSVRLVKIFLFQGIAISAGDALLLMQGCRNEFDTNIHELRQRSNQFSETVAQLEVDLDYWIRLTSLIDQSSELSGKPETAIAVVAANEELLRNLNTTVKLYEQLAERSHVLFSWRVSR